MASAISIDGLRKSFRSNWAFGSKPVLHGIDLEVQEGRIFGFLGPNGAGKTTTIKILVGLVHATAGRALLLGQPAGSAAAMQQVGFLPENPYFYEYLTSHETLHFYGSLFGLRGPERKDRVERLLEEFDLARVRDQRIRTFSKGMRQRLGMAQALVGRPRLVILDEPQSGLDPIGRYRIKAAITRLRDEGVTVFFSSHILGDVEDLCDDAGLLVNGRLVRAGPLQELLAAQSQSFELKFRNVTHQTAQELADAGLQGRLGGEIFTLSVQGQSRLDAALQQVRSRGGLILSLQPVRETLEDYFVRVAQGEA
jgi:ABC-2 type transport system ATP-binding protein